MKLMQTILMVFLIVAIGMIGSSKVGAYGLFTADPAESGRCSQCHTDWPGATHSVHTAFDCGSCHVDGAPVPTSSCSACHQPGDVLGLHSPLMGPGDNAFCGYCHAGVNAETHTWGELKALFH